MSKNEMTPGPWEAVEDPAYDDQWDIRVGDDGYVCEGCSEPDARAIAEVPNMVAVLRELADAAQGMEHWPGGQGLHDPLDEARAILARIDGEKT